MTLPDDLVQAATNAPCLRYPEDFKCGEGHILSDSDDRQHPECVLAAVLRALPESEAVLRTCELVMQKHLPLPLPDNDAKHPGWVLCMCHGHAPDAGPNLTLFQGPVFHRRHVAALQAAAIAKLADDE